VITLLLWSRFLLLGSLLALVFWHAWAELTAKGGSET
jgi:hypothetical protein